MDKKIRCDWGLVDDLYIDYHDKEWGVPVFDDRKQFEFIILESAQAGLSWHTILKKRNAYRKAYNDFDPEIVAKFRESEIKKLLSENSERESIIKNEAKVRASVNNAGIFLKIQKDYGSFSNFLWNYVDFYPIINPFESLSDYPAKTVLSETISKDLKKMGFSFFGPVITYSHLQATGVINDHMEKCFRQKEIVDSYKLIKEIKIR